MYSQRKVKNEQEIKRDEHIQLAEIEENATKEHLDTIMRMNPNAMSTFRLNVTKNTVQNSTLYFVVISCCMLLNREKYRLN